MSTGNKATELGALGGGEKGAEITVRLSLDKNSPSRRCNKINGNLCRAKRNERPLHKTASVKHWTDFQV